MPYDRKMMAVHAILPIEENYMLIGTQNGIFIYNTQEKNFSAASVNTQITDKVNSIIRNHDGDIWAGTALGLYRMRWTGKQLMAKTIYDYKNPQWAMVGTDWVNILINDQGGTGEDIERLGETVRARVKAKAGVTLEWEIIRLGLPQDGRPVGEALAKTIDI